MTIPFTHDQFLHVFAQYNESFWWFAILLWLATVYAVYAGFRKHRNLQFIVTVLLTVHWVWSGFFYHIRFFSVINPAATVFGIVFIAQGALLTWSGLVRKNLEPDLQDGRRIIIALVIVCYGLIYPLTGLLLGEKYPYMPVFAVPCPTDIITLGWLILIPVKNAWAIAIIPFLWAVIGGSAAIYLGVIQDAGLVAAGILAGLCLTLHSKGDGAIGQ